MDPFAGIGTLPGDDIARDVEASVNDTLQRAAHLSDLQASAGWKLVRAEIERLRDDAEAKFRSAESNEAHVVLGLHRALQAYNNVLQHIDKFIADAVADARSAAQEW